MTRKEQLKYCKVCLNRKMDLDLGILCNLTGKKADFQNECKDYKKDETAKSIASESEEGLLKAEIQEKLSTEVFDKLRTEQKLKNGIIAGIIVGIIGAILWAIITVSTQFQIGYMAIAIGAGVGLAIRKFGNGIDHIFGFWGAGIALLSCLLGNFLSTVGFVANAENLGYVETLLRFDYSYLPQVIKETFRPMDLLFYGIAIYEGYKLSFRLITEKEIDNLNESNKKSIF